MDTGSTALKILQWNAQSLPSHKGDFIRIISEYKPQIICISETWFKKNKHFHLNGYNIVRKDRYDNRGGVAILILGSLSFVPKKINFGNPTIEGIAITLLLKNNKKIDIISIYNPDHEKINSEEWQSTFSSFSKPFVCCGDFNSHHKAWGSEIIEIKGRELYDAIMEKDFVYLNDGSHTRIPRPNQKKSCVDLTITDNQTWHDCTWKVIYKLCGSDHYPILTEFKGLPINNTTNKPIKYKISQANWEEFTKIIEHNFIDFPPFPTSADYPEYISRLYKTMDETIPKTKPNITSSQHRRSNTKQQKYAPWWDPECTNESALRDQLHQTFNETRNWRDLLLLCKKDAETKKLFKKKQRMNWSNFLTSLHPNTPLRIIYRKIKSYKSRMINPTQNIPIPEDLIEPYINLIAPTPDPSQQPYVLDLLNEEPITPNSQKLVNPFTLYELERAIKKTPDTAPGKDQIPFIVYRHLTKTVKLILLHLYNDIWKTGNVPAEWKEYLVIPALKPGKEPTNIRSFRPIAKGNCIGKIFEHLIKNRLIWWAENNNKFADYQYGFRPGRSTIDNIISLIMDVQQALSENCTIVTTFLDIQGAFDTVPHHPYFQHLQQMGVPLQAVRIIKNLITQRTVHIEVLGSIKATNITEKGLPQGAVLSPTNFNFYTNDMPPPKTIRNKRRQYADDLANSTKSYGIPSAIMDNNTHNEEISQWLKKKQLAIEPDKVKAIIFSRQHYKPGEHPDLYIDNKKIEIVKKHKHLGIYIDKNLTWKSQIQHMEGKATKRLNMLKTLAGVRWGCHPSTMLTLYKSVIRSQLEYGAIIFHNTAKTHSKRLDIIQNQAIRTCMGYMRSSPIAAMEVEANIPPLAIRRQFLADKYFLRTYSIENHPVKQQMETWAKFMIKSEYWAIKPTPALLQSYKKLKMYDPLIQKTNTTPPYNIPFSLFTNPPQIPIHLNALKELKKNPNLNTAMKQQIFEQIMEEEWPNEEKIFTDGSKVMTPEQTLVGAAVYDQRRNESILIKLPSQASIFTAELAAIRKATEYIHQQNIHHSLILTDSLSAATALVDIVKKNIHPLILDIHKNIAQITSQKRSIGIIWIPGHSGIQGNNKADELAKAATTTGTEERILLPYTELISIARAEHINIWQEQWTNKVNNKATQLTTFKKNIAPPWFKKVAASRTCICTINRLRIGHCLLNTHLHRLGLTPTPKCRCGLENDTLQHRLFNCPRRKPNTIRNFENILRKKHIYPPYDIQEIIKRSDPTIYRHICVLLSANNNFL